MPTVLWSSQVHYDSQVDKVFIFGGDTCGGGSCDRRTVISFDLFNLQFDTFSYSNLPVDLWHESNGIVVIDRIAYRNNK